jgi:pentatricopeptide repeat protein
MDFWCFIGFWILYRPVARFSPSLGICRIPKKAGATAELRWAFLDLRATESFESEAIGEAISACEKVGAWSQVLKLLEQMAMLQVEGTKFSYNTGIKACGKARQWELAVKLFTKVGGMCNELYAQQFVARNVLIRWVVPKWTLRSML